jgi:putative copper resistance protein D
LWDALAACRCLHFAAGLLLFGTCVFLASMAPLALREVLGNRARTIARWCALLAILTAVAIVALQAGELGDGWHDMVDPGALSSILFGTSFGRIWLVHIALALILAIALFRPGPHWASAVLLSALFVGSLGFIGHAAMQHGAIGLAHRLNHAVHLLAAGVWLGGLVPLIMCLGLLRTPSLAPSMSTALRRFSGAGHLAVALVLLTGVVNIQLILGGPPLDFSSPYQVLLVAKIALVASMVMLALFNRYVLVPRLAGADGALRALTACAAAEVMIGAVVLALVSVFGMLNPE